MREEQPENVKGIEARIVEEIGNLSSALGRIRVKSKAVDEAREALLRLSILIGEALHIKW